MKRSTALTSSSVVIFIRILLVLIVIRIKFPVFTVKVRTAILILIRTGGTKIFLNPMARLPRLLNALTAVVIRASADPAAPHLPGFHRPRKPVQTIPYHFNGFAFQFLFHLTLQ
jgi:hypothetical protein